MLNERRSCCKILKRELTDMPFLTVEPIEAIRFTQEANAMFEVKRATPDDPEVLAQATGRIFCSCYLPTWARQFGGKIKCSIWAHQVELPVGCPSIDFKQEVAMGV